MHFEIDSHVKRRSFFHLESFWGLPLILYFFEMNKYVPKLVSFKQFSVTKNE